MLRDSMGESVQEDGSMPAEITGRVGYREVLEADAGQKTVIRVAF